MILALCPNPSVDKQLFLNRMTPGSVNKSRKEYAYPGGKGVHVALALKELGMPVTLAGFWGGPTGEWIRRECNSKEIRCIGPEIDGWTRTCLTLLSDEGPEESEITENGPAVTRTNCEIFFEDVRNAASSALAMVVSGSWPEGAPEDVYMQLKAISLQHSAPLWVDASGDRLKTALEARPFGVHINQSEASSLFGKNLTPQDAAQKLLSYCEVAAVTNGADGLHLATKDKLIHTRCTVDKVISTVGCGDCLTAGLALGWSRSLPAEEVARLGTACGSANCIRPELGMLHKNDVDVLIKNVQTVSSTVL